MKHKFKFLTFLLLFALSFGFNQEVKAKISFVVGVTGTGTSSSYGGSDYNKMKLNAQFHWGGTDKNWLTNDMSKAGMTFEGLDLYITSMTYDDAISTRHMQFQKYKDGTQKWSWDAYDGVKNQDYWENQIVEYGGGKYSKLTMSQSYVYFDATNWNQTSIKLVIGHANHQKYYSMTRLTNTNLYYNNSNYSWTDAMGFGVVGNTTATDGDNWLTNVSAKASEYTGFRHYELKNNSGGYLVTNKGKAGEKPEVSYYSSYSDLDKKQTISVMLSTNGGSSYSSSSTWRGIINANRTYMSSATATTTATKELDGTDTKTYASGTITSTFEFEEGTTNTGYTFVGFSESSITKPSSNAAKSYTVSDAKTIYAFYKANGYQVEFDGNGATSGSMNNEQYYYGVSQTLTANAFERTNYNFVGWNTDKDATTVLYTDGKSVSNLSSTDGDVVTLYAIWALAQVDVTYGVFGSANGTIQLGSETPITGNATQKVDGASTVVFTATPDANYTVEGWYDNASCTGTELQKGDNTGNPQTYTIPNIAEAKTVYVKFREIDYSITLSKGTGISAIKVAGTTQTSVIAHVATKTASITADVATGYTWKGWVITSGNITATPDLNTNGIQINATSNGTLTATATEILHDVTMAPNDVNKGTAEITSSNKKAGIDTKIDIKATPKAGYYFTGWVASDPSKVTFGDSSSATTTAKVTADDITITANFAAKYSFRGSLKETNNPQGGMPGWGNNDPIEFTNGEASVSYTLQANKTYKFQLYNQSTSNYQGYQTSGNIAMNGAYLLFNGSNDVWLETQGAGEYTFDIRFNSGTPEVKVSGPTSYQITFGKGTGGNSISASSNNDGTINSNQYVKTGSTVTFTQTPLTGYEFKGWYTSADGSTTVDGITTEGVMANVTADKQVYAQYKPITYNITYPASPEHYTINTEAPKTADFGTTSSFTVTPDKGYLVDVTAVKTGSATSVTLQRSGNTYTIQSMPAYDVTINVTAHKFKLNGWGTNSSDKEFDANWEYKENLDALTTYEFKLHNTASGLSNNGYFGNDGTIESTITSGWTMSDNEGTKLKLKTGIAGTYTFTYCEVEENGVMKPQIKVTFPQVSKLVYGGQDYPFTDLGNGTWKAGPLSLAANTTLSNNIRMYWEGTCIKNDNDQTMSASSHTDWGMERYTSGTHYIKLTTAGSNNTFAKNPDNYYFYYKPNASPKPTLTVEYPSYWRGDDGTTLGWNYDHPMEFVNDVATIELDVQTSGDREMKVIVEGQYWTYEDAKITTSTNDIQFVKDDQANKASFKFNVASSMKGIYTFTFNRATHKMSVNYPDVVQYDITYTDAEGTKTIKAGPNGGRGISAANKPGYKFVRWDLYPDDINKIAVAGNNVNLQTTTVYGKAEGCSITAIYTNEHFIYFKNIPNWGDVYVQFYSNPYFHGSDASTDKNKGTGTGGQGNTSLVNNTIYHMTRIDKTDIWYFDYSDFAANAIAQHTVAFTDSKQDDHSFFDQCQVVYRGDFGECAPMMVPINYIDQYLNQHNNQRTCYYGQGHWMKYDAAENTAMGIKLHIYEHKNDKWVDISGSPFDFLADNDGSYSSHASGINLPSADYKYHVKLEGCATGGTWYGNTGKMTSAECTNWVMSINTNDMEFEAKSAGPYTFRLSTGDGQLKLSAEYPLVENDFRVIHTEGGNTHITGITYKHANAKADTASFYFNISETSPVFKVQKCTSAANNTWADVSGATFTNPTQTGIYNFIFSHDGENVTIQKTEPYTGKFYIRTEGVDGGMESYKGNADNEMTYYGSMLDAGATYSNFQYNYYKAKWIWSGKDVTFCIANDYSKHISSDFTTDAILNSAKLPQNTNVRFMWNSETNQLSRAYISGSTNIADRFLVLIGDEKMFDKNGDPLNITDLNPNEINFSDNNNWVYQADIKAKPGCAVKLTAKYNSQVQYFIGTAEQSKTIIDGTKTSDKQYAMRAVYDFKTNRLVAGWVPDGTEISSEIKLGGDMLLVREHQGNASQITFGATGSVSDIHHIYSVLTIKKDVMLGQNESDYTTAATNADYERTMYWISFPFDVKISEVFGVDGYGKKWIMQRYNGEKRAEIGWFQETETFWEYLAPTSTLQAYKGYLLILNANYFNTNGADVWKNSATEANFYFPSAEKNIGIINKSFVEIEVHAHECKINRPFADGSDKNHKITDSYWNVIGVPAFQNHTASATPASPDFKSYYAWVPATNTYDAKVAMDGVTFKTMHAYMVQFGGTLKWTDVSVVNNPTTAPYHYADAKNYRIELFFSNGEAEDHTYINLADEASTDFVLNEDMMKIDNAGVPNIYSFAGAYDVAYNETTFDNQTVMLGVSAPKDGSYTFAMPKDFSGKAILIDLESGEATDLNLSDYTVDLNKGTYNNRFQLVLEVEAKSPTTINNAKGEWSEDGKTKKLLIRDQIYLINAGRVYNATGAELR